MNNKFFRNPHGQAYPGGYGQPPAQQGYPQPMPPQGYPQPMPPQGYPQPMQPGYPPVYQQQMYPGYPQQIPPQGYPQPMQPGYPQPMQPGYSQTGYQQPMPSATPYQAPSAGNRYRGQPQTPVPQKELEPVTGSYRVIKGEEMVEEPLVKSIPTSLITTPLDQSRFRYSTLISEKDFHIVDLTSKLGTEDSIMVYESFDNIVDDVATEAYAQENDNNAVYKASVLYVESAHVRNKKSLSEILLKECTDYTELAAHIKSVLAKTMNKEDIRVYLRINTIFTEIVNEVLVALKDKSISIDSYKDDYEDLLQALTEEDRAIFLEMMNKIIRDAHTGMGIYTHNEHRVALFAEKTKVYYIDAMFEELNITEEDVYAVSLPKSSPVAILKALEVIHKDMDDFFDVGWLITATCDYKRVIKLKDKIYLI